MKEKETKVLKLRFGICGHERETVYEIACRFKVTTNRIYQIQHKALRKLLHPSRRNHPMIKEILETQVARKIESQYPDSYTARIVRHLRERHQGR